MGQNTARIELLSGLRRPQAQGCHGCHGINKLLECLRLSYPRVTEGWLGKREREGDNGRQAQLGSSLLEPERGEGEVERGKKERERDQRS